MLKLADVKRAFAEDSVIPGGKTRFPSRGTVQFTRTYIQIKTPMHVHKDINNKRTARNKFHIFVRLKYTCVNWNFLSKNSCAHKTQETCVQNQINPRKIKMHANLNAWINIIMLLCACKRHFSVKDASLGSYGVFFLILKAFDILKEAVNLSDAVLHDVQSVSTLSEVSIDHEATPNHFVSLVCSRYCFKLKKR